MKRSIHLATLLNTRTMKLRYNHTVIYKGLDATKDIQRSLNKIEKR